MIVGVPLLIVYPEKKEEKEEGEDGKVMIMILMLELNYDGIKLNIEQTSGWLVTLGLNELIENMGK